jgi:glycosyltransferase involved in cell wall biosynthesis
MSGRHRILFLSHCLPYPPHSGVTSRTFNVLKQLHEEFDVTLLPFFRRNHQPDPEARRAARAALEAFASRVGTPVPILSEHTIARRLWDHFRSVVTRRPYTYYEHSNRDYRRQLRSALAEGPPALVHLDNIDLHAWLPELPSAPHVCTHHNIESDLLRRRAAHTRSLILRRYILHQAALVERVQRQAAPWFRLNIMMSDLDAERLRRLAPQARTIVVPNGVDTAFFVPDASRPAVAGRVVFLGPTYVFPNRDGMEYLLEDIWPHIRSAVPSATLRLIGKTASPDRLRYEQAPGIACLGFVPDIRPHMAEARCCVVPLRVGGGTRLKILDAWAMGKAVVSTSLGCEGLEAVDGENILIRDDPREFAQSVVSVLSDAALRRKLELGARKTAEQRYSWDKIGERLRTAYRDIIESRSRQLVPQG